MRIIFAGTPDAAVPTLQAILNSEHEIVGVITQPPAPTGRGRKTQSSAVAEFAQTNGLPLFEFENINSAAAEVANLNADIAVIVAYGQLLKPEILRATKIGWMNLHFSLLPAWRGAAPVQHAIMAGDEITGTTTFLLDEGMDTGPIVGQSTIEIWKNETAGELLSRLAENGAGLVLASLDSISEGQCNPIAQSGEDISYAPKLTSADSKVNWQHPALRIHRLIRGCTPAPGAWSLIEGERIGISAVELMPAGLDSDAHVELSAGSIKVEKNRVLVGTGSGPVVLDQVKPAGKGWMKAADWARGVRFELKSFDD